LTVKLKLDFGEDWVMLYFEVARRPWAPRTFLEFLITTDYVLDSWKASCCP